MVVVVPAFAATENGQNDGVETLVIGAESREDMEQYLWQRVQECFESMSIGEATISNMWETAAIVDVLERKGLLSKGK
jgi:hypothetical protein